MQRGQIALIGLLVGLVIAILIGVTLAPTIANQARVGENNGGSINASNITGPALTLMQLTPLFYVVLIVLIVVGVAIAGKR